MVESPGESQAGHLCAASAHRGRVAGGEAEHVQSTLSNVHDAAAVRRLRIVFEKGGIM